jgi:hypothetical protein
MARPPQVEIVDGSALTLDPEPVTVVGGPRDHLPGHALHLVRDAVLLTGATLVIAVEGSQSVLYFSTHGALIRESGRSGDGPGEFRLIRSIHRLAADTVAVWDAGLRRVTLLDPTGRPAEIVDMSRVWPEARPLDLYAIGNQAFAAISASVLIEPHLRSLGFTRDTVRLALVERSGRISADLGTIAGNEWFRAEETIVAPYSYRLLAAAGLAALYVGNGRSPDLVEYSANGATVRLLKLPILRRPNWQADLAAARERFLRRFPAGDRGTVGATFDKAAVVDSFPAFTDLQAASNGTLWIQLYDAPANARQWLVIDPAQGYARRVLLPPGAVVLDADEEQVVILQQDSLGREEVRLHRFRAHVPDDTASH